MFDSLNIYVYLTVNLLLPIIPKYQIILYSVAFFVTNFHSKSEKIRI